MLIYVHRGLTEMELPEWPKQAAFILFRQRNSKFERNWPDKEVEFGCLISKQFKKSLGLGRKLVKKKKDLFIQPSQL